MDTDVGVRPRSLTLLGVGFAAAVTLGAVFALGFSISLVGSLWPASRSHLTVAALVEVLVTLGLSLALVSFGEMRAALARAQWRWILLGCALGVLLHGPADFVEAWVQQTWPVSDAVWRERVLRLSPAAPLERSALFALVALAVPVVEELFFRGALFSRLHAALSPALNAGVTSLCFTLSHVEPRSWPALSLVAAALGVVRLWTQSLLPCILLHATFNATTLSVVFLSPRAALQPSEPSLPAALVGGLASVALLSWLGRESRFGRVR
ncbi:MAG: CPBP family intramembrane metalloprotease [Polyangiaceae bacterium]